MSRSKFLIPLAILALLPAVAGSALKDGPPKLETQVLSQRNAQFYDLEEVVDLLRTELRNPVTCDDKCEDPGERPELDIGGASFWEVVSQVEQAWSVNAKIHGRSVLFLPRPTLEKNPLAAQVSEFYRVYYKRHRGVVRVDVHPEPRFPHIRWQRGQLTGNSKGKRVPLKLDAIVPRGAGSQLRFFLPRREYPEFDAFELVAQGFVCHDWKPVAIKKLHPGAKGKAGKLLYEIESVELGEDSKRPGRKTLTIRLSDSLTLWQPEDFSLSSAEDERNFPRVDGSTPANAVRVAFGNLPPEPSLDDLLFTAESPHKSKRVKLRLLLDPEKARR